KAMMHSDPAAATALITKLTIAARLQLEAQVAAGAQAVQIFESWLGELDRDDLEKFVLPRLADIAGALEGKVPTILFSTGTSAHLERLASCGFDVISVDWRIPINEARARLRGVAVQGNLDPALLVAPKDLLLARTKALLA